MTEKQSTPVVLIVDDEKEWLTKLSSVVSGHTHCEIVQLDSYEEADKYVTSHDVTELTAAVIDVRLRKQIYDQGGLTVLSLLKDRNRELPTLVLTAYSYDYPGLRDIVQRYPAVYAYDKEVFEEQSQPILDALFADLPPQIGDSRTPPKNTTTSGRTNSGVPPDDGTSVWREIGTGGLVIGLILAATSLFFILSNRFTGFSWQLNVVFAVVIVSLIAVLLRIFKPDIVTQAVSIYKDLVASNGVKQTGQSREHISGGEPDVHENAQQKDAGDKQ